MYEGQKTPYELVDFVTGRRVTYTCISYIMTGQVVGNITMDSTMVVF